MGSSSAAASSHVGGSAPRWYCSLGLPPITTGLAHCDAHVGMRLAPESVAVVVHIVCGGLTAVDALAQSCPSLRSNGMRPDSIVLCSIRGWTKKKISSRQKKKKTPPPKKKKKKKKK